MPLSETELKRLSSSLIGDQAAKVGLLMSSDAGLLNELFDFGTGASNRDLKMDILFTALHLDEYIRDELGELYIIMVQRVYRESNSLRFQVHETPSIKYKYARLINLCVEFCPSCPYPHASSLQDALEGLLLLRSHPEGQKEWNGFSRSSEMAATIELLTYFLRENEVRGLNNSLAVSLENSLRGFIERYSSELQLKYAIRVKISKSSPASTKCCPFSNKGLELNTTIPNAVNIDNPLERNLLSLSLALCSSMYKISGPKVAHRLYDLCEDNHFCTFVASLLKSGDINLRCAALMFLTLPYFTDENAWSQKQRLNQILPYLVDCLNYKPLPWWYDPFNALNSLIELYHRHEPSNNPVILFLSKTNVMYGLLTLFADCLSLKYQNKHSLRSTTRFITLCASFAAYDEVYRLLLLEQKPLLNHLEFGLEKHLRILEDFLAHKKVIFDSGDASPLKLPPFYDNELTMAWLTLLKSCSRSVSALRTSLKRNKLAELLLDLLKNSYQVIKDCKMAGEEFLKAEIDIMGVTLGCLCNFVVEFSNLQSLISSNGIVALTGEILKDPLFNWRPIGEGDGKALQANADKVKTHALWVLRHLMYNCRNPEKLDLLSQIPMSTILEFINDPSWPVQEQCFELLRNLTCNSRKVVNILLENFKDVTYESNTKTSTRIARGTTYLFQFLARKIKLIDPTDGIQKRTLVGVLYIIVNLVAVNENKKELVIQQDEILAILHDILYESQRNVGRYGNDSKLKLATLWVLNNLLWNSAISHYTHYALEGYASSPRDDEGTRRIGEPPYSAEFGMTGGEEVDDDDDDDDDGEDDDDGTDENLERGDDDDDDDDDEDDEFVHDSGRAAKSRTRANDAAIKRCKRLIEMGIYDLVKQNEFDESLSVREKARTLRYHMDLLLKDAEKT